jgi:hypothetical protein
MHHLESALALDLLVYFLLGEKEEEYTGDSRL